MWTDVIESTEVRMFCLVSQKWEPEVNDEVGLKGESEH